MKNKSKITSEELTVIKEINNIYGNGVNVLIQDYKPSKVKLKMSNKKTIEDKVIDMFIDGDCPDTIRKSIKIEIIEVVKILTDYGAI